MYRFFAFISVCVDSREDTTNWIEYGIYINNQPWIVVVYFTDKNNGNTINEHMLNFGILQWTNYIVVKFLYHSLDILKANTIRYIISNIFKPCIPMPHIFFQQTVEIFIQIHTTDNLQTIRSIFVIFSTFCNKAVYMSCSKLFQFYPNFYNLRHTFTIRATLLQFAPLCYHSKMKWWCFMPICALCLG